MKQLTNNKTTINKEINYSPVIAMEIKTLDDTFMFSYNTNIIDFYIDTLKNYLPLNLLFVVQLPHKETVCL